LQKAVRIDTTQPVDGRPAEVTRDFALLSVLALTASWIRVPSGRRLSSGMRLLLELSQVQHIVNPGDSDSGHYLLWRYAPVETRSGVAAGTSDQPVTEDGG
jgi:hypothetical protein